MIGQAAWRNLFETSFLDVSVYGEAAPITGAFSNPADVVDAFACDLTEQENRHARRVDER